MTAAGAPPPAAEASLISLVDVEAETISISVDLAPEPDDSPMRAGLIERVRSDWILGVLDRSVHAAVLQLNKDFRAGAVAHPWRSIAELPGRSRQQVPPGQTMTALFEEVGRGLLILGGPGSGKTISLLQLARDLLDQAAADRRRPVPVYFNLSNWTERLTLADWLVQEFRGYEVPARQARQWLETHRLILLLDGLDEVRAECRAACVEAINAFLRQTGTRGIAVCSRLDEYTALRPLRLTLRGAVCLEPLTPEQVDEYLTAAGPSLGALREALESDEQLQTLASTPLMLSVMSLAYHDLPVEALRGEALDTVEERRTQLFSTYVQRMFERRAEQPLAFPVDRTLHWLAWLARGMRQHAESVFLIERLQPDWLLTPTERWSYLITSRLLCGAAIGIVLGLSLDLGLLLFEGAAGSVTVQAVELFDRMRFGLLLGVVDGLMAGGVDAWRFERSLGRREARSRRTARQVALDVVSYVLALGFAGWILIMLLGGLDDPLAGLTVGLLAGLLFGTIFGLHDSRRDVSDDIRTVEALRWSWAGAGRGGKRGFGQGMGAGVVVGIVAVLIGGPTVESSGWIDLTIFCLLVGLLGSLVGGVLGASFGGLSRGTIPTKAHPNQGIALSVRNAVLSGLLAGGAVGGCFWLAFGLRGEWAAGLTAGLVGGLFFGMLAALRGGMLDVIQHYTLRLVLAARGYAPFDYSRLLDHSVWLALLQRAGGGYLFIHRLLLEHFSEGRATPYRDDPGPAPTTLSGLATLES